MKRALKWIALAVVALLVIGAGSVWYIAFSKNRPIVDGEIAPGVRTVKDGFVSVAVLDAGPGKVALIDCGNDKSAKETLAELQRRGLGPSAVSAIFLTHGHPDHTNGCRMFPDAEIWAMATEAPMLAGINVRHQMKDGDAADVGPLHVEAFATPGHTPGSAVYFARGVLFFGDSAGGAKDGSVMHAVSLFSKDPSANVASLKSVAARMQPRAAEVKVLAFAHSGPLEGLAPLTTFAAQH